MKRILKYALMVLIILAVAFIIWYPVSYMTRDKVVLVMGENGREVRRFEEFGISVKEVNGIIKSVYKDIPEEQLRDMKEESEENLALVLEANKRLFEEHAGTFIEQGVIPIAILNNTFNMRGFVLSLVISMCIVGSIWGILRKLKSRG